MQKPEWNFLCKTSKGMRPGRTWLRTARARKLSFERKKERSWKKIVDGLKNYRFLP